MIRDLKAGLETSKVFAFSTLPNCFLKLYFEDSLLIIAAVLSSFSGEKISLIQIQILVYQSPLQQRRLGEDRPFVRWRDW